MADAAAVPGQPVRGRGPFREWQQRADILLDLVRVGMRGPAKPLGEPGKVGVHDEARLVEGIPEHQEGGLAAHARPGRCRRRADLLAMSICAEEPAVKLGYSVLPGPSRARGTSAGPSAVKDGCIPGVLADRCWLVFSLPPHSRAYHNRQVTIGHEWRNDCGNKE